MELFRSLADLGKVLTKGSVVTIGNFDGVHLGHQQVLAQLATYKNKMQLPSVVILFEPHPKEFFLNQQAPARLMRLREKLVKLKTLDVDFVLCLKFDQQLSNVPATKFVEQVLVDALTIKRLIVGDDFHFGARREGDFTLLEQLGETHGFEVTSRHTLDLLGERVSSTRIRQALCEGDLKLAETLLGCPFSVLGRVVHGNRLGRELGFPTANINLKRAVLPVAGIFVVKVLGIDNQVYYGAANVGNRPTVCGQYSLLEIYILDFDQMIYGTLLEVEFIKKLRDEERYDNLELLKVAIANDVKNTQNYLKEKGIMST